MIKQYRKKPVVIEAWQVTDDLANSKAIAIWAGGENIVYHSKGMRIKTLEGQMDASIGDYIIKGVKGEFYPCKPDIFDATYEPVTAPTKAKGAEK